MAWIKWHIGAGTDPKFRLITKMAKTNIAAVLGVWILLLERAGEDQGRISDFDPEVANVALGIKAGKSAEILAAMEVKGLINNDMVTRWEERQAVSLTAQPPAQQEARQPEGAKTGAERSRKYRERQKNKAGSTDVTVRNVTRNENVTERNENVTALKEEIRLDNISAFCH